ncbi:MAG TPA: fructosamine kinase family protein, partial [Ignavibacteriaceae bacterium]|nr:fructosamine kinase family protein [Ignavibacteriaceae bacterium]
SKIGSELHSVSSLSGGCISNAYKIIDDRERIYFLKINSSLKDLFIKEANGLNELRKANAIKVPEVFFCTEDYLLAEFVLQDKPSKNFFENFGRSFAELHKFKGEKFGFFEDNYIGSNPQINISGPGEESNWSEFYFNKRIFFQYKLAEKNGYATKELKDVILQLENKIEKIIETTNEAPSILHGDLWSGNFLVAQNNNACLIDPAVYYGHREADLAMTKLFGGFSSEFYSSYNEVYPLEKDYEYRENIYKLYHVLNHLNLFGKSYYPQSISMIKTYLK